jgi:CheY-like chemotaxis protein
MLCNLSEDLPTILGDTSQIHQVILNIVLNAKDAMKGAGKIIISTEIVPGEAVYRRFPKADSYEYILVGVNDNGEGMSKETLAHIFEPFFTTKVHSNGTGLGLSIVTHIMEQHHGFIEIQSQLGIGTNVSLYFPAEHGVRTSSIATAKNYDYAPDGQETIMIVEDDDMLNELLNAILASKGYNVLRARNGRQAVKMYRDNKERVSLVISDLGIPGLTGAELLTWLKEINPQVKFILSTGYIDTAESAAVKENGASEIMMKPYNPSDLLMKIREVLDR